MPDPATHWSRIARRVRVPLGFLFAVFYFWRARPTWLALLLGGIIAGLGVWLRALASGHVRKNRELTRSGPYAYVRNPLYLGSIIIGAGFAAAARDVWVAVGLAVLFVLIYLPVIRSEEAFLQATFVEFDDYRRSVPQLLPRRLSWRGAKGGFSRELYFQHREYNAALGTAAMLAALAAKTLWFPR
jgi:protein-S-isoprenylcysteine O-methyltransferase Ste14